jgi:hypothetical protein
MSYSCPWGSPSWYSCFSDTTWTIGTVILGFLGVGKQFESHLSIFAAYGIPQNKN